MVFEFGKDWIVCRDVLTVRMALAVADWDIEQLLVDAILEWSSKRPVSQYWIGQLNWKIAKQILDYYLAQLQTITEDSHKIHQLIRTIIVFETNPLPGHEIMLKYGQRMRVCFPCVDNEANLITLPSGNNVETMRYDDFVIIEAIINAKAEYIKREQAKLRR